MMPMDVSRFRGHFRGYFRHPRHLKAAIHAAFHRAIGQQRWPGNVARTPRVFAQSAPHQGVRANDSIPDKPGRGKKRFRRNNKCGLL